MNGNVAQVNVFRYDPSAIIALIVLTIPMRRIVVSFKSHNNHDPIQSSSSYFNKQHPFNQIPSIKNPQLCTANTSFNLYLPSDP